MKRHAWLSVFLVLSATPLVLAVQEPFCTVPANCVDDVMSIRFADNTSELTGAIVAQVIPARVVIDVKSQFTGTDCPKVNPPDPNPPTTQCTNLQGFSYGVKHDPAVLTLSNPTHKGVGLHSIITSAPGEGGVDFKVTKAATGNIGFIQAIVVTQDADPPFDLPHEDGIVVALATYTVAKDPGTAGTKIQFSNDISPPNSPPTATNLTINGKSKQPKNVNNAVVKGVAQVQCTAGDYGFYFGSAAAAGEFDIASAASVKVSLRNKGVALGFSLGIKKAADKLTFESTLGSEAGREVDLVVTKADGTEANGAALKGNTAKGATGDITGVDRGAALTGNNPGDFLGVDIVGTAAPDVGGPGVTVGYVADVTGSSKTIPAITDAASGACGVNEVLVVKLGGVAPVKFSRGDANGDGKINVTDGVVIAQNIFATKLVLFDCKDMLDVNDDGALNTADPVFLLTYVFLHGPAPAAPFKSCATDPTSTDSLDCKQANCQ
jgi:hypothetical protein